MEPVSEDLDTQTRQFLESEQGQKFVTTLDELDETLDRIRNKLSRSSKSQKLKNSVEDMPLDEILDRIETRLLFKLAQTGKPLPFGRAG